MLFPPRFGNRRPVTPGISPINQLTSVFDKAFGRLLRYTVDGGRAAGSGSGDLASAFSSPACFADAAPFDCFGEPAATALLGPPISRVEAPGSVP
jgi:hypothetical protein